MIKYFGLIIIFFCISLIGIFISNNFSKRVKELREFERIFYSLKNEVLFLHTPITQALIKVASNDSELSKVLKKISNKLENGNFYTLFEVVESVLYENMKELYLSKDDIELICDFFREFENSNLNSLESVFYSFKKRIEEQLKEAIEDRDRNSKTYKTLGFGIGAIVVIFLI